MKTLAISIHDPNNIGDQVCCPADYFDIPNVVKVDAWDFGSWMYDTESNMIFGGGGLIHGILAQVIHHVQRNPNRKLIAWGLGHNQHGQTTNDYGGTLDGFDLVGVRDFKRAALQGWDYVPCASCMSPEFNQRFNPRRIYGVLCHFEHPILLRSEWPVLTWTNQCPKGAFPRMVEFIESCETIVTNSYHGAYWAALMERQLVIYKPFSSRFHDMEWRPPFCDENDWSTTLPSIPVLGFLKHCREINRKFYEKVKTTLGIHTDGTAGRSGDSRDIGVDAGEPYRSVAEAFKDYPPQGGVVP